MTMENETLPAHPEATPSLKFDDLIARLEKATGPDREIDGDLLARFMGWDDGKTPSHTLRAAKRDADCYTDSIDAAMRLVPKDWAADVSVYSTGLGDARVWQDITMKVVHSTWTLSSRPATPAIALCIAALKARAAAP